ncbi:MFS transporter [Acidiferrobacter sp. SPIII_3]|uniref:MFS transporter n=1 Tax=Acidiferrobacter sp. SPIII_3 TaxID=1281578 RepID=UPI00197A927F|nr:MFS transporter [Acidiferrobacter sp. SPIII_3]
MGYARLTREARLLIVIRAARSVGQGALVVDFALYLHALHWSAPAIGGLFMVALLASATLALFVGPLSDTRGRKAFLQAYEWVQVAAALMALTNSHSAVLVIAAILGGFGHGLNGGAGPFAPVELAWLSEMVEARDRAAVYSLNTAMGFSGMALGALLAALPSFLGTLLPGPLAYRPLFLLVLMGAALALVLLRAIPEAARPMSPRDPDIDTRTAADAMTRAENRKLLKLFGINALNGIGIGFMGPLMAYWFAIRFHHGPLSIGPIMSVALIVTAISSLLVGRLTRRYGVVKSVLAMRYLGLAVLLILPLSPSFPIAALLYIIRSALNRGTAGARQALNLGLVRGHRRGLAASLNNASIQMPRAIGPVFAGLLYHAGFLALPFFIAGSFQAVYLILYRRLFRDAPSAPLSSPSE